MRFNLCNDYRMAIHSTIGGQKMKIKQEHYNFMKKEIQKIWTIEKHNSHREFIINEGKAKDIERRLRFDWSYYAKLTPFICDNLYSYANDNHINTALKNIIGELVND